MVVLERWAVNAVGCVELGDGNLQCFALGGVTIADVLTLV